MNDDNLSAMILERLRQDQQAQDEKTRREQEEALRQSAQRQQQQVGLGGGGGGMNPMQGMQIAKNFMPASSGASAAGAGSAGGTASGATAGGTAGGSAAGGAAGSAGGGLSSGLAAAGPWAALAAAIVGHNEWAERKGLRDGENFKFEYGLTGRALYKDKDWYAERADKVVPGLGDDINIAGSMSSPVDLFRGDTWKGIGKSLAKGGVVGGLVKKLF